MYMCASIWAHLCLCMHIHTRAVPHISMCGLPGLGFPCIDLCWHDATFCLPLLFPFPIAPGFAMFATLHLTCFDLASLDWIRLDSTDSARFDSTRLNLSRLDSNQLDSARLASIEFSWIWIQAISNSAGFELSWIRIQLFSNSVGFESKRIRVQLNVNPSEFEFSWFRI